MVGESKLIEGQYYTVNPMAIRAGHISVFSENVRSVTYIDSDHHGRVAYVCIGAMLVGSIVLTSKKGERVKRMDEHGYFAFGGSTIVLLFPPTTERGKSLHWDGDLVRNSSDQMETLVKVGMRIGRAD